MEEKKANYLEFEESARQFWKEAGVFQASVERSAKNGDYTFYDGPPFATGTMHYGHMVGQILKDVVPRFWTMNGYRVERKWGWDCHGLPVENIVEKELGITNKQQILDLGIEKFNDLCRSKVLSYVDDWKEKVDKLGRWVDMENPYQTMDLPYMESVWAVFKQLWDRDLIYEGYRSMYVCPRCETTLSQSEVSEGYKDIKDLSVVAKFKLDSGQKIGDFTTDENTFVLAWTTTPWTLPGNVALAIALKDENKEKLHYIILESKEDTDKLKKGDRIILAYHRNILTNVLGKYKTYYNTSTLPLDKDDLAKVPSEYEAENGHRYISSAIIAADELVDKKYQPLFSSYYEDKNLVNHDSGWKIKSAEFVTMDAGTGVVHIAPGFGEDDLNLGKKEKLPFIQHVGLNGIIKAEVKELTGLHVKPIEDVTSTDVAVIKYLAEKNLLFAKSKYEHSYPHCWRCETPLINYATTSWFVNVTKIKGTALETAKEINWSPDYIKEGRFGNWLEGARDWSISRQRFWASVMPIWRCDSCTHTQVFGSVKELEDASGETVTDLHKHVVDKITFACTKGEGGTMKRVPDVLDTWFDSGSMPYAQLHYPFENKERFEENFPANFIAEGIDQTRTWFYYLHVLAAATMQKPAFKNVIVNGTVLAEDGKKMSKRLQNYPDPTLLMDKFGADALRAYLLSSPVVQAENLNFTEKGVEESLRKNVMIVWNVFAFYEMYVGEASENADSSEHVLDIWIIARLNQLITMVTKAMQEYNLPKAMRPITDFIDDLSTWYLRRSRDRFKEEGEDKQAALATMKHVLTELAKIMAPFTPFIAEALWQKVTRNDFKEKDKSVHLEMWPEFATENSAIISEMEMVRKIVELGLAKRDEVKIKVRQPLGELKVKSSKLTIKDSELIDLIKDELNIKEIVFETGDEDSVELDTALTPELEREGLKREIVRLINSLRKNQGLTISDRIALAWSSTDELVQKTMEEYGEEIKTDTLATELMMDEIAAEEHKVNNLLINLSIRKL